jgi:hypothetical protein
MRSCGRWVQVRIMLRNGGASAEQAAEKRWPDHHHRGDPWLLVSVDPQRPATEVDVTSTEETVVWRLLMCPLNRRNHLPRLPPISPLPLLVLSSPATARPIALGSEVVANPALSGTAPRQDHEFLQFSAVDTLQAAIAA